MIPQEANSVLSSIFVSISYADCILMNRDLIRTSRFLSLVLRHRPQAIGLQLDQEGWADIEQLIRHANARGNPLTRQELQEVVDTNDKQRFAISADGSMIRANQGHSVQNVRLRLDAVKPPDALYHGTVKKFVSSIRNQGLRKRSRHHVHLSVDQATATKVAARRGEPIILTIAAREMDQQGYQFFLSENGVWLTDRVPTEFIAFPSD